MTRRALLAALAAAMTILAAVSFALARYLSTSGTESKSPAATGGRPPAATGPPSWRHVPAPDRVRPQAGLNGTVAFGPDHAWAVGADAVGRTAQGSPLLLRWDGTAWQRQRLPGKAWKGELLSVAGSSADAVWAVGRDSHGRSRLFRYDGKVWNESATPRGVTPTGVAAGGGATWLFGSGDGRPLLLRDGHRWREMPAPPGSVYGLHVLADDDVWAAGGTDSGAAVSHWDGRKWHQTIVEAAPRAVVSSVLAVSPTEVWAGGSAGFIGGPAGRPVPPLLARWDGKEWNQVDLPTEFGGISSLSPTNSGALGWVAVADSQKWGAPGSSPTFVPGPDLLAWNGRSFTEYSEPEVAGEGESQVFRLTPVPGTETAWSVGRAEGPDGTFAPRVLRFE